MSRRITSLAASAVVAALVLAGCAGGAAPEPTETATPEPTHTIPQYDSEAAAEPSFTVSGRGERIVRIEFPSDTEGSILSVSTNGRIGIFPLTVDGDKLQTLGTFQPDQPNITVVFPATGDNLAASDEYLVQTDEDVSWAISTQALGSVPSLTSNSITGTDSQVFRLDFAADTMIYTTTGFGATEIDIIYVPENQLIRAGRGANAVRGITTSTQINPSLIGYEGYIFVVSAYNPSTQGWRLTFQQSQPEVTP